MISLIVAKAQNNAIGKGNRMPWHISGDLRYFKKVTTGHPVIMGYNTWVSLGARPLPGRTNMVISRNHTLQPGSGALCFPSLESVFAAADHVMPEGEEIFIIGGGQLYRAALPFADRLYITEVETVIEDAEVFFPEIDPVRWKQESRSERMYDEKSGYYYSFLIFTRK